MSSVEPRLARPHPPRPSMTQPASPAAFDVCAVGNAIVDVLAPCDPAFLEAQGLVPGSMQLVDADRSAALYAAMAAGVEASGGSAGNTVAGVGSFGGRAAYIGKVADDQLGGVFTHDIHAVGVHFATPPLAEGATGVCMINVTPGGQRTMCTFLGAANQLTVADIDADLIGASQIVYLEGYLFDPAPARAAFEAAAADGTPIMVFVGSHGCIQIHTGPVSNIRAMGPWINVMDPTFNLHLRNDHVADAWVVRKPTSDGVVTSLEVFDAKNGNFAQFFGERKPGRPELPAWRELMLSLCPQPLAA